MLNFSLRLNLVFNFFPIHLPPAARVGKIRPANGRSPNILPARSNGILARSFSISNKPLPFFLAAAATPPTNGNLSILAAILSRALTERSFLCSSCCSFLLTSKFCLFFNSIGCPSADEVSYCNGPYGVDTYVLVSPVFFFLLERVTLSPPVEAGPFRPREAPAAFTSADVVRACLVVSALLVEVSCVVSESLSLSLSESLFPPIRFPANSVNPRADRPLAVNDLAPLASADKPNACWPAFCIFPIVSWSAGPLLSWNDCRASGLFSAIVFITYSNLSVSPVWITLEISLARAGPNWIGLSIRLATKSSDFFFILNLARAFLITAMVNWWAKAFALTLDTSCISWSSCLP